VSSLQSQILGNRFAALAREGAARFSAMSRSALVIDEGQYACAILNGDGQLIAQDQGEPSQLAAVQASVAHLLDAFAFNLTEGDVILTGDPYCGGTWGGVLMIVVPVFWDGDLQFLSAVRFGAPDLAGDVPGPFQPDAHEIWQEALRVTPVKLFRAGALQKDVRQYITRNTRSTTILDSDLTAANAIAQRIGTSITSMIETKGLSAVQDGAAQRTAYGAARAASVLARVPDGRAAQGRVAVTITSGSPLIIDLTGSDTASEGSDNMTPAMTKAVILAQLAAEVIEDVGLCQGILDAIEVRASPNSLLSPEFPSAVSLGWRLTAPMLASALAEATGGSPVIYPAPSLVVLFPEIGSTEVTLPVALSPGFTPCPGFSGSDAASGRRRIISAEQLETAGALVLEKRELGAHGMEAIVRVAVEGLEAIPVPGGCAPEMDGAHARARSGVLSLSKGSSIRFDYPVQDGGSNAAL
jgi:N-methylhydantoinase B